MFKNFRLGKEMDIQLQEAQSLPKKDESKEVHTDTHYNQTVKS